MSGWEMVGVGQGRIGAGSFGMRLRVDALVCAWMPFFLDWQMRCERARIKNARSSN